MKFNMSEHNPTKLFISQGSFGSSKYHKAINFIEKNLPNEEIITLICSQIQNVEDFDIEDKIVVFDDFDKASHELQTEILNNSYYDNYKAKAYFFITLPNTIDVVVLNKMYHVK